MFAITLDRLLSAGRASDCGLRLCSSLYFAPRQERADQPVPVGRNSHDYRKIDHGMDSQNRHIYYELYFAGSSAVFRSCGNPGNEMGDQEMAKKESQFQAKLIKDKVALSDNGDLVTVDDEVEVEEGRTETVPFAYVLKNDSGYIQGFPDLTILYKDRWAVLETKRGEKEHHQPNQDHYVDTLNSMSYSSFIFPENKEKVFDELEQAFKFRRRSRVSKREQV